MDAREIIGKFQSIFGINPEILVKSPGRINLIGEHTDYNYGFALPAAINKYIWLAFSPRKDRKMALIAANLNEQVEFSLDSDLLDPKYNWTQYFFGACEELKNREILTGGFNCVFGGNLTIGSGLSSSAALSCGIIMGIGLLAHKHIQRSELAELARNIEIKYLGLNCGFMDQLACLFGKKNSALFIDCESNDIEHVSTEKVSGFLYLIDSGVKHNLAADKGYNKRYSETREGLLAIQRALGFNINFRQLSYEHICLIREVLPIPAARLEYYLHENERVLQFVNELKQENQLTSLGSLLNEAHRDLSALYEATCFETDILQQEALRIRGVLGARQVGGGFGGAVLVLADEPLADKAINKLKQRYFDGTEQHCTLIKFELVDGCDAI